MPWVAKMAKKIISPPLPPCLTSMGTIWGRGAKSLGEAQFLLMAALMMADDLHDTRRALTACEATKATEKPVPEKSTPEKSKSVKTEITPTDDADRSPKVIVDIEGYLRRLDKMAARLEDDDT